ncbi:MAG: hypothetical protein GKS06_14935 [Acidobacteria bacterium]|nr:hypothetical protein [Acidobacteriota bacterium]
MGLLDWLGGNQEHASTDQGDIETVRRIAGELDALPADRARYVACFAYILGRVAHADLDVSDEEIAAMESIVAERADLPVAQAALVVQIAKQRNELFGGTDNFLVTRTFAEMADQDAKRALLDCLYAVSAADNSISAEEDQEIRRITGEINLGHDEFIRARAKYVDQLSVMQD